jgi:hypothetical protein
MATAMNMTDTEVNSLARASAATSRTNEGKRLLLTVGGVCGVLGAVLAAIANGLHPHPSDFRFESLLQQISQSSIWSALHLTLILALVLILCTMLAITLTTTGEVGGPVAHFASLFALLGGALILVSTAIDGFGMNQIAYAWSGAAASEKATALRIADGFESAGYAVYSLSVVLFLGVSIFLYGLATTLGDGYPRILGWLAMLSGAGTLLVGVVQTLGGPAFRETEIFFVLFSMSSTVWVFVMGVLMWRKGRREHANEIVS